MKNYFRHLPGAILVFLMLAMSSVSIAQISAIYSGGTIYREDYAIDELRNSGFTTVIIWTIHIAGNGDLGFNGEFDLVRDGVYVGDETYPDFPSDVLLLKTAPTSINRVEFGLSSAGSGTFNSVEDFYNSEGFGPGTTLYENFAALRDAIPGIDAFNNDDEVTYDTESAVAFTRMLADLGFQNAIVPYTNSNFWSSLVSQVNATHPGNIDRNYLQCYAGGSGNSPCSSTWDFGIPVIPGLWGEGSSNGTSSPSEVESQMNSWQNQCGITGGFMWLYGDFDNSPQVAAYAAAINDALAPEGPPTAATNPNPSNGASNVSVGTTLSWTAGANTTSHDVYFGTDATPDNSELQGNQTSSNFNPGTLSTNTTYYWRVDEVNSSGTATGPVWSFTTESVATSNLAPDATISVSSEYTDANWSKEKLTDGIIGINGTGEWASNGEVTPWAQLDWDQSVTTSRVVLYDRPTSIESISSGTLTFSNGSSVSVGALPDDGSALEVNFSERTVDWIRFQVNAGEGPNNGMSEFEVFGSYGGGGGNPQPPVADFTASATAITEGASVSFTDQSSNSPTSWSWTFSGGSPASSSNQNPTVTYSSEGTYDVILTATNADGSDTETKTGYITVSAAGGGSSLPTFYLDCDYGGGSFSLDVGSYDRQTLMQQVDGFVNNAVSSIEVPAGYSVTLYNRNLSQSLGTYTADDNCLNDNGADNATTSLLVSTTSGRFSSEIPIADELLVYPNPFENTFKLTLPLNHAYRSATVIDISGKELMRTTITSDLLEFDLSAIATGSLLFLKLEEESESKVFKLIRK